jgi:hypothetical protein
MRPDAIKIDVSTGLPRNTGHCVGCYVCLIGREFSRLAGGAGVRPKGFPWATAPAYLVRDNDRAYGHVFTTRVRAMGIRDRPISPGSPWQNGCAERLIGTLRRECLDQLIIFSEMHLRRILSAYAEYYNQARTHLALRKDAPLHRAVQRLAISSPFQSRLDCITNMSGYDFRKGQLYS